MNPSAFPMHSSEAEPNRAIAGLLRPQFCGRTIVDIFFGDQSTLMVLDNGSVLEVGAWVLSPLNQPQPA